MRELTKFNFVSNFRKANIASFLFVICSFILILFKGLNFGIDFKGGTLMEIRTDPNNISISDIRSSISKMNLGDLNVKEFGNKGDYLIKFEKKNFDKEISIKIIKENIIKDLQTDVNFRRVENVGPKVSADLLKSG